MWSLQVVSLGSISGHLHDSIHSIIFEKLPFHLYCKTLSIDKFLFPNH